MPESKKTEPKVTNPTTPVARTFQAPIKRLRAAALALPEAVEEFPWGHSAFKIRKKSFGFLYADTETLSLSVKLPVSAEAALLLPFAEPTGYGLGGSGWVTARFAPAQPVPVPLLLDWLEESYRTIAPKKLVAALGSSCAPTSTPGRAVSEAVPKVSKPRRATLGKAKQRRATVGKAPPGSSESLAADGLPLLCFATQRHFERWLERNHGTQQAVWLQFAKKGASLQTLTQSEAVDSSLCFGWIDGLKHAHDAHSFLLRFTARRAKSKWSMKNRQRFLELEAEGRIRDGGRKEMELACADGRWERAYEGSKNIKEPEDFLTALKRSRRAEKFYKTISAANRFAILFRVLDAKRAETRARRISAFVQMLAEGKTIH